MPGVEQKSRRRTILARILSLLLAAIAVVLYVSRIHERQSIEWPGAELLPAIAACFVLGFLGVTLSRETVLGGIGLALLMFDVCVFVYVRWVYDPGYGDWGGFEVIPLTGLCLVLILLALAFLVGGSFSGTFGVDSSASRAARWSSCCGFGGYRRTLAGSRWRMMRHAAKQPIALGTLGFSD